MSTGLSYSQSTYTGNLTQPDSVSSFMTLRAMLFLFALFAATATRSNAQTVKPADSLFRTVAALDTELFDAVNRCDVKKIDGFWADDAEFYHDKGGLMIGRKNITESIQNNLCGKVQRELVPGTLKVYPMDGYGAVEMGVHRFHHPGVQDHGEVGEAKFIHLWQHKDGAWRITRVISYDHGPAK